MCDFFLEASACRPQPVCGVSFGEQAMTQLACPVERCDITQPTATWFEHLLRLIYTDKPSERAAENQSRYEKVLQLRFLPRYGVQQRNKI